VKYPPYPSYKPSGVAWLGDVPVGWEVKRLKHSASVNDESLPETTDPSFEFSYVDISSVDPVAGIVNAEEMVFEDAPSRARRIVREGDTIVSTVRTYLRAIAPIRACKSKLIVSTGFAVIRPRTVDPDFLSYALQESGFVDTIVARSVGVSYPAVNASEIATISIPLPSPSEQHAIADFLDRQTGRIDTLIAKRRALIERLKEKRSALISRTVTRGLPPAAALAAGLDPHSPLKPSGVEWLGDVPAGWIKKKITSGFRKIGSGTTPKSDSGEYYDGDIPWVTTSELRENTIHETKQTVTHAAMRDYPTLRIYPEGTVLFAMYGATIGRLGILGIPATVNQACCAFAWPTLFEPRFVYYWLWMRRPILVSLSSGGGQPNLSQNDLRKIQLPIPPLPEQRAIADFLDRQTAKIDRMVSLEEAVIGRMQEYRSALITATVTGKIDVRRLVA